jgi:head-tail adaptor
MSRIHAGMLKHRIMIEQAITITDDLGGTQKSWQLHRLVWAHLAPLSTIIDTKTQSLIARSHYHITLRSDESITVMMRAIIAGQPHLIDSVMPHAQEGFMVCRASGEYL